MEKQVSLDLLAKNYYNTDVQPQLGELTFIAALRTV